MIDANIEVILVETYNACFRYSCIAYGVVRSPGEGDTGFNSSHLISPASLKVSTSQGVS